MIAFQALSGPLQAVASDDLVGVLLDFAVETSIDELDVEAMVRLRPCAHTEPLVVINLPGLRGGPLGRQLLLSADTGRHAALLLSGVNRQAMALALWDACDRAEASAHWTEQRRRAAA